MRTFLLLLALFACSMSWGQMDSLIHDGLVRTYLVHLPVDYSPDNNYALVLAMHGGFGSATNLQNQSQLSRKADEAGFIVVYPEGIKGGLLDIRTWNGGECCGYASDQEIDDVGFIDTLLDVLIDKWPIDSQKVYATGMSNGAILSYRLACELSHRIAAIAPVAGTMSVVSCQPDRAVPIMHLHSYLDSNVLHAGGVGMGIGMTESRPFREIFENWSSLNNCQIQSDTLRNDAAYTQVVWRDCDCQSELQLFLTRDGGHSWPSGRATPIGDPVSTHINANNLMWEFFQDYSLSCSATTRTNNRTRKNKFDVWPNVTSDRQLQIVTPDEVSKFIIQLYTINGHLLSRWMNQVDISLDAYPPGSYIIEIVSDQAIESHRIFLR